MDWSGVQFPPSGVLVNGWSFIRSVESVRETKSLGRCLYCGEGGRFSCADNLLAAGFVLFTCHVMTKPLFTKKFLNWITWIL